MNDWTRKSTAAVLVILLGIFPCTPAAMGQQSAPAATASPTTNSPTSATSGTPAATIPPATTRQSAKARELFQKGADALRAQHSKRAMKLFAAAHKLEPANGAYLAGYEIARQQQIGGMLLTANADQTQGQSAAAKETLLAALRMDPDNPYVAEHLESLNVRNEPAVLRNSPMPEFSNGLIELTPDRRRATFHTHGTLSAVLLQVCTAYGITASIDDSVQTKEVRLDLTDASFAEAEKIVQLLTGTFFVALDPKHVLIAKDTKENRTKYERLLYETISLPGQNPKDLSAAHNMITTIFGVHQTANPPSSGSIGIRAPEATLRAINTTVARLYLTKPEVMLDIRVYQLSDSRQEQLGVAFPQSLNVFNLNSELSSIIAANQSTIAQLISAGLVNPGDLAGIAALLVGLGLVNGSVLNQPFALFGNGLTLSGLSFGGTTANATLNISNTHELDHVQLRAGDSEKQSFLLGSRYPIVTQSYSAGSQLPTAATGLSALLGGASGGALGNVNPLSLPPSIQYEDLGLKIKAIPYIRDQGNIEIRLEVEISSLAGASVNGSPIINNRSFQTAVQVQDGGSAMIASTVSQTESRSLSGIPGLSELPGFAWTASPSTQLTVGKLLIVISPRIISATHPSVATQMLAVEPEATQP